MRERRRSQEEALESELAFLTQQTKHRLHQMETFKQQKLDYEIKGKLFSVGEFNPDAQELMLQEARDKVGGVYALVIGENEAHLNAEQMLMSLESHLETQLDQLEVHSPELLEAVQMTISKKKRVEDKAKKLKDEKVQQEERIRKAMERSMAAPKKKLGRPLMFRSRPKDAGPTKVVRFEEEKSLDAELELEFDEDN